MGHSPVIIISVSSYMYILALMSENVPFNMGALGKNLISLCIHAV